MMIVLFSSVMLRSNLEIMCGDDMQGSEKNPGLAPLVVFEHLAVFKHLSLVKESEGSLSTLCFEINQNHI